MSARIEAQSGAAFDLAGEGAYLAWRAAKLARHPKTLADIAVDVRDPRALSAGERQALLERRLAAAIAGLLCGTDAAPEGRAPWLRQQVE